MAAELSAESAEVHIPRRYYGTPNHHGEGVYEHPEPCRLFPVVMWLRES